MSTQSQSEMAPLRAALSWRLLLAWVLAALIPSLAASLPMMRALDELLGHVPHGAELARRLNPLVLVDTTIQLYRHRAGIEGGIAAWLILTLLMAPFAAGLAVAAYTAPPRRFFALVAAAFDHYARLFGLMIVSLIPFSIAGVIAALALDLAQKHAEKAVLETAATHGMRLALVVVGVALLMAELTVEAARAQFAVDGTLRSPVRAWVRGVQLLRLRPGAALGRFVVPTLLSLGAAALFAAWRVRAGVVTGFVATQLAVAAIGWGRAGRILALAQLSARTKL
jgi:hypothetical protein